jgi:hypothetical protein
MRSRLNYDLQAEFRRHHHGGRGHNTLPRIVSLRGS